MGSLGISCHNECAQIFDAISSVDCRGVVDYTAQEIDDIIDNPERHFSTTIESSNYLTLDMVRQIKLHRAHLDHGAW